MRITIFISIFLITFCTCIENKTIDNKADKDRLIAIAKQVYNKGLTSGTGGDISVRIYPKDQFIIKATGYCLGVLNYDRISTMNTNGNIISGNPKPSSEAMIHAAIYTFRPEINAIMHVHSPYATAWATAGKRIPAVTQQSYKLLKQTGLVHYNPPASKQLEEDILACYKLTECQVVMMENHGFFVIGTNLDDILYKAEVVENTAKIAYLSGNIGEPIPFTYHEK